MCVHIYIYIYAYIHIYTHTSASETHINSHYNLTAYVTYNVVCSVVEGFTVSVRLQLHTNQTTRQLIFFK